MLSVIIPVLNEEKYLSLLLNSLLTQTFQDFEIIVADANSQDETKRIALNAGCKVVKGGLPGHGRNNGARVAKGEWLLFLDADVILPSNFLEKAMMEIKKKNFFIATCKIKPLSNRKIDIFLHYMTNLYLQFTEKIYPHAPGFCIFCKKETHQLIKGFNENLKLAEDHDYVFKASKFAKFGLLKDIRIPVSVRRLDKDGRFNIAIKYFAVEVHRIFLGPINSNVFNYKFGHFSKKI